MAEATNNQRPESSPFLLPHLLNLRYLRAVLPALLLATP
jgi:hypothetical protein